MEINTNTSPELAIKIAYDSARSLRANGADIAALPSLLSELVEGPYERSTLLTYIRAGFTAGFNYESLPWRREIDGAQRN